MEYGLVDGSSTQATGRIMLQVICHGYVSAIARFKAYIVMCHILRSGEMDWAHSEESKFALSLYELWQRTGVVLGFLTPQTPKEPYAWPHWRKLTPQQWLTQGCLEMWEKITAHQAKAEPSSAVSMDPYEAGDVPVALYAIDWLNQPYSSRCICTAPPVWQEISGGMKLVAPEFVAFLTLGDIWEEPHLMVRHSSGRIEDPIDYLDTTFERFHLLQLPRDSDWAQQAGEWADLSSSADWKRQFIEMMTQEKSPYRFPKPLAKGIEKWVTQALDLFHKEFFKSKKTLSVEERRQLIELIHLHLVQHALTTVKAVTWNACGQTRLNGGQLTHSLIALYNLALLGKANDTSWGDRIEALTWGPYLEAQYPLPSKEEVELFTSVGQLLIAHEKNLPALWKQLSKEAPEAVNPIEVPWV
jgi:hypothetical protein